VSEYIYILCCEAQAKTHCTVYGMLELNEQTNNKDNAINYWRQ